MREYAFGSSYWRNIEEGNEREWMQANGVGGYAGHTIIGGGNRLHHGYLVASLKAPINRYLVFTRTNDKVIFKKKTYDLTSQNHIGWAKNGHNYLTQFKFDGVPEYTYQVEDMSIKKTVCIEQFHNTVVVCYDIENGMNDSKISVTPLFNYKPVGDLVSKSDLKFNVEIEEDRLKLIPRANKNLTIQFYKSEGTFYDRALIPTNLTTPNFVYDEHHFYKCENDNGIIGVDTHFTPYDIEINVKPFEKKKFYFKCTVEKLNEIEGWTIIKTYKERIKELINQANLKDDFANALVVSADQFIVERTSTKLKTIIAGYPWFTDWGRDTMIALHGLTLTTKRYEEAKAILRSFAKYVKNGLIPNMFPDDGEKPLYNTVDGSLWYFYAVERYLEHTKDYQFVKEEIYPKLKEIILAYKIGTDFNIKMDEDGLIIAGDGNCQLTWMDAMIGNWVVTPRSGKPVEINALWYNALCTMKTLSQKFGEESSDYEELAKQVKKSFVNKFWNEKKNCLYDVVEENEDKIRCNQIWAISLPYTMLPKCKAKAVVQTVYKHLYTPYGLRSLSYEEQGFVPEYKGTMYDRDACYHMGTTWAYPMGGFITAYCKVNDYSQEAIEKAKKMCLMFKDHLNDGCIGGIAEIFDGMFPNKGKGCYNQAWSVAEILRVYVEEVLEHEHISDI